MQQMMRSTGKGLLPYEAKLFGHCDAAAAAADDL
jgi:hypothetical protein